MVEFLDMSRGLIRKCFFFNKINFDYTFLKFVILFFSVTVGCEDHNSALNASSASEKS